jgi:hypothetical protein
LSLVVRWRRAAIAVGLVACAARVAGAQPAVETPDPTSPAVEGSSAGAANPTEIPAPVPPLDAPRAPLPSPLGAPAGPLTPSPAPAGPAIEIPAGDAPLSRATTTIGGYGQLDLKFIRTGFGNDFTGRANVRRVVLLVGHQWTDAIRSYVELEWENAVACAACQGVAEVEQAYLEGQILGPRLALRAGLILLPMGIINTAHEPPAFFSVDRPSFDQSVIPSTWRELGVGLVGRFNDRWRAELYLMTGLDPTHLGPDGIGGGRGSGTLVPVRSGALVGRVELEPRLGTVAGLAGYASDMGPNGVFFDSTGARVSPHFPIYGWAFDGRSRYAGFELRLVAAQFFLPRSGALVDSRNNTGALYYPSAMTTGAVANRIQGGYVELAYDVLRLVWPGTSAQLLAFARAEYYDTQAAVPVPFTPQGKFDVREFTAGLSFLPIRQVVVKTDFQLRDRRFGLDDLQIDFGIGWLF